MKMTIVAGRDFSAQFPADSGRSVIINETAVKRFGWSDPIGKKVDDNRWVVVGVVKDFHPYGVNNLIRNCMMILDLTPLKGSQAFAFRVSPGNMKKGREILNSKLEAFFPDDAFEIISYADFINTNEGYRKFISINNSIRLFTILNILLAVMGLLGLVAFTTQQKSKEIATRKINGCLISIVLFCGLLAGSYPAFYLSSLKPLDIIKGVINKDPGNAKFRSVLVVFQFTLSIILIICTFIIGNQLKYMQNKKLGFNKDNIGYFMFPIRPGDPQLDALKKELSNNPDILSVTKGYSPINLEATSGGSNWTGKKAGDDVLFHRLDTDEDYLKTSSTGAEGWSFLFF